MTKKQTDPLDDVDAQLALTDLTPDPQNARTHGERNVALIERALQDVGTGRSIVIDENGVVLAGNATLEAAARAGIKRVTVIESDGRQIIAVRRKGLTEEQKTRLAIYDNRAAELSGWNHDVLVALAEQGLTEHLWTPEEWAEVAGMPAAPPVPEVDPLAPPVVVGYQCPRCATAWTGDPKPAVKGGDDAA